MRRLRAFSQHNMLIKIISLILAFILWSYITGEETQEAERMVPLEIILPDGMTVVSRSDENLFVTVSGSRSGIDRLASRPLTCVYSVGEDAPIGRYVFEVTRSHIRTPHGIRVVAIKPSVVNVVLDRLVTRRLPVKANLVGKPADGFHVPEKKILINPDAVLISGPENVLNEMKEVVTEHISLVGQTRPFFRRVGLAPVKGERRARKTVVDVTVPVEHALERHILPGVPVRVLFSGTSSLRAKAEPDKLDLIVTGSVKEIQELELNGLVTYVDVSGLQKGRYELPLKLVLPPSVILMSELPVVTVTLGEDLAVPLVTPASAVVEPDLGLGE